jgi:TetR/AcrR family tetracycline transcriptional repressor
MDQESKRQRNIDQLERKRLLINKKIDAGRRRINERFDQKAAELTGTLNKKQERIVDAALRLLDADGLTNLSLRKLATGLDMKAPAIYWHFKNKEMLVDAIAEAILQEQFSDFSAKESNEEWQPWLLQTMRDLRHAMLAHTDGARVVAGAHFYPAVTLGMVIDLAMQSLCEGGLNLLDAQLVVMTAIHYTFGHVIEEQSSPSAEAFGSADIDRLLGIYPTISAAIGVSQKNKLSDEDIFTGGIQLVINGYSKP